MLASLRKPWYAVVATACLIAAARSESPRAAATDLTFVYEAEAFGSSGSGAVVDDPDALNHQALTARIGREMPGIMRFGPYSREPAGRYRADFRLKVQDNTVGGPVVGLDVSEAGGATGTVGRELRGTDFARPNVYQTFSIEFDRSDIGAMEYRVYWRGNSSVWADRITVVQLKPFEEVELLQIYAKRPDLLPAKPKEEIHPGGRGRIFVCNGLWHEYFHLEDAAKELPSTQVSWGNFSVQQFKNTIENFPKNYGDLYAFDAVVLADCDADSLGLAGKLMISDYVHDGGGLIVLGGLYSYGRGGYTRSKMIGDLLPLKGDLTLDLKYVPQGVQLQALPNSPLSKEIRWGSVITLWYHLVSPKEDAIVAAKLGDDAALILGRSGKGKVACLTLAPIGEPAEGQLVFWKWNEFPKLLASTIQWVAAH